MIDSAISLAFSMHANKGVYAILLGSGVSRSAGIPTGWDVVIDLIRRLAHLQEQECTPDPETWFRNTYGQEPNYSTLLAELAKSPPERNQILRGYFEADAEEREQGLKMPTAAHRAIANLVASGHIRVIVTTNFDRLIERALEAIGITASVIDSPEKIDGAMPLVHSPCTVVKLHGDYMDIRFKNTPAELMKYDDRMNRILDQVLDEFGLIICGWSADYDMALEEAIARCPSRRFTTYWGYKDRVGEAAQRLIAVRRAEVIKVESADSFFQDLAEKVISLDEMAASHPLSVKVAISTEKKYLAEEKYDIRLHDLLMAETGRLLEGMSDRHFPTGASIDKGELQSRVARYETLTDTLLGLVITGCYWSKGRHAELWSKILRRVANPSKDYTGSLSWEGLRWYPALLLIYGGGIASIAAEQYGDLASLLLKTEVRVINERDNLPAARAIYPATVFDSSLGQHLPGMENNTIPVSNHLYKVLRAPLTEILPQDDDYTRFFDQFEYLFALIYADLDAKQRVSEYIYGPPGLFTVRYQHRRENSIIKEIKVQAESQGDNWPLLKAGFFDGSYDRLAAVIKGYEEDSRTGHS